MLLLTGLEQVLINRCCAQRWSIFWEEAWGGGGCRATWVPAEALAGVRRAGTKGLLGLGFLPPAHPLGSVHPFPGERSWFGFAGRRCFQARRQEMLCRAGSGPQLWCWR